MTSRLAGAEDRSLMPIVVDASALVLAMLGSSPQHRALRRRLTNDSCHAPHLIDAEVGSVLRRRSLRGELPPGEAEELLVAAAPLIDHRHEMTGTVARGAWALRQNVSFYDALYVALALALGTPLLTADSRLAGAPGLAVGVELLGAR